MARLFDGTNDSLQVALNLSAYNIISIGFWLWWDGYANNDDLAMEHTANFSPNAGGFFIDPNSTTAGGGKVELGFSISSGVLNDVHFARPSAAAWHRYVVVFTCNANPNTIAVYVDGVSQTLTWVAGPQTSTTGVFANSTLNVMCRNNASLFGAGRMADLAIWGGAALSAGEAAGLSGVSALRVRPTNLSLYAPLYGVASPEPNYAGTTNLTVNGAVITNHAPVAPPFGFDLGWQGAFTEAVAGSGLLRHPGMSGMNLWKHPGMSGGLHA